MIQIDAANSAAGQFIRDALSVITGGQTPRDVHASQHTSTPRAIRIHTSTPFLLQSIIRLWNKLKFEAGTNLEQEGRMCVRYSPESIDEDPALDTV